MIDDEIDMQEAGELASVIGQIAKKSKNTISGSDGRSGRGNLSPV